MAQAALVVAEQEALEVLVLERVELAPGVAAAVAADPLEPAAATLVWISEIRVPAKACIRKIRNKMVDAEARQHEPAGLDITALALLISEVGCLRHFAR